MIDKHLLDRYFKKLYNASTTCFRDFFWRKGKKITTSEIVLYCSDEDRGMMFNRLAFAQILDSYRLLHLSEQSNIITLASIGSKLTGKFAYGDVYHPGILDTIIFLIASTVDTLTQKKAKLSKYSDLHFYKKILKKTNCKQIIAIQPPYELIISAQQCNVDIYDLQHGDICPGIPYYEYVTKNHINLNYLVWNEETKNIFIKNFKIKPKKIKVTGNPWLAHYKKSVAEENHFYLEQQRKVRNLISSETKNILVTLQWGLKDYYPSFFKNPFLSSYLIDAMKSTRDVTWLLRPHPITILEKENLFLLSKIIKKYQLKNVHITDPYEITLPAILNASDAHITWHSSTIIEATDSKIPSLILSPEPYNYKSTSETNKSLLLKPYFQYQNNRLVHWITDFPFSKVDSITYFVNNIVKKREHYDH